MQLRYKVIDQDCEKNQESKFINVDGEQLCIKSGENNIHYKITITPNKYAPVREYILELTYKFMHCDRLQFLRDVDGAYVNKNEIINSFPINILQMKVFQHYTHLFED